MSWTIILLSFIPAVLWILYFYYQDRYEKEPFRLLLLTFIFGCLSVIPALLIEIVLQWQINYFIPFNPIRILISMLMVGVTEELVKYIAVKKTAYCNKEFNEPMDGIVYCVTAAMGFAFVENIGYMLRYHALSGIWGAYSIGLLRAIFSMFGHASFAVIMGSYLGRAKFDPANEKSLILKGLIFASLVHALYNYTLSINKESLSAVIVLFCFLLMWRNMNRVQMDAAVDNSPFKPPDAVYQPRRWKWGLVNIASVVMITTVIVLSIMNFNKLSKFTNKKMNYHFMHPSFWQRGIDADFRTIELKGPSYRGNEPKVRIIMDEIRVRGDTTNAREIVLSRLRTEFTDMKVISREETTMAGKKAHRIIVKWKKTGKFKKEHLMLSRIVIAEKDKKYIAVICESREDQFDKFNPQFLSITNSIHFINPEQ